MSKEDIIKDIKSILIKPYGRARTASEDYINDKQAELVYNKYYKKIADLEAKLAKAQKTIENQRMSSNALMEENLEYRWDITDSAYEYAKTIAKGWEKQYQEEISQLKQQLAEKEKEIEQLNNRILISQLQAPKEQILNILGSQCIQYNPDQDKISFAVEKLEQIKKFLYSGYAVDNEEIEKEINNQIEELKKEMK